MNYETNGICRASFHRFDRWYETPECMKKVVPNWDGIHDEFKVWWVKKEVDAEAAEK